jgi:N-acetylmuramic acid 6-phosphate etherase
VAKVGDYEWTVTRSIPGTITAPTAQDISLVFPVGIDISIALNTLSSSIMVRLNKVYGNLMVDVLPTNAKLIRRAVALTRQAAETDEASARSALEACGYRVKVAIVMLRLKLDVATAQTALDAVQGSVRRALKRS